MIWFKYFNFLWNKNPREVSFRVTLPARRFNTNWIFERFLLRNSFPRKFQQNEEKKKISHIYWGKKCILCSKECKRARENAAKKCMYWVEPVFYTLTWTCIWVLRKFLLNFFQLKHNVFLLVAMLQTTKLCCHMSIYMNIKWAIKVSLNLNLKARH